LPHVKKQPLVEVFGYPINNMSATAKKFREEALCPYNNIVAQCTKNSIDDPLGVCAVFDGDTPAITCPIRFRENWTIVKDAAEFFFPKGARYRRLSEIRLKDAAGKSAGNIDHVLVSLDKAGKVIDFGVLEVQGVYISGNVTEPFKYYMKSPETRQDFDWNGQPSYPSPDYLSSSRKRLAPQLVYKGGILKSWGKKIAVAVDEPFWATLPKLRTVSSSKADIAWFVYGLELSTKKNQYHLTRKQVAYTEFDEALLQITKTTAGPIELFINTLDAKIRGKAPLSDDPDPIVDGQHDVA